VNELEPGVHPEEELWNGYFHRRKLMSQSILLMCDVFTAAGLTVEDQIKRYNELRCLYLATRQVLLNELCDSLAKNHEQQGLHLPSEQDFGASDCRNHEGDRIETTFFVNATSISIWKWAVTQADEGAVAELALLLLTEPIDENGRRLVTDLLV
jgi:hypothetical protein